MLPGRPYRVVVASLNICRWGVGCHAQTGRECQSYDPRDKLSADPPVSIALGGFFDSDPNVSPSHTRSPQPFCKHIHILRRLEAFSLARIVRHVAVRQFLWRHVRVSASTPL